MLTKWIRTLHSRVTGRFVAAVTFTILMLGAAAQRAQAAPFYRPIDFSSSHNNRLQDLNPAFPYGNVTLGTIPFTIPVNGNNYYNPWTFPDLDAVYTLEIPVNSINVTEVHTLMNLFWGDRNDFATRTMLTSHASVEFFGTGGAYYKKDLYAGDSDFTNPLTDGEGDFRDVFHSGFTSRWSNKINGTTTTNVFSVTNNGLAGYGPYRLDKQKFTLPGTFVNQVLTKIVLTDTGRSASTPTALRAGQRVFLAGVTDLQSGPSIVTPKVQFTLLQTYPGAGAYIQVIRVTNLGQLAFQPNLNVAFTNLPTGVTVAAPAGTTSIFAPGSPYVNTNRLTPLLPGQSVNITVKFNSASPASGIPGTPELISGPGAF